tara:strand:- start:482 stop:646 length:165 start_codon:yes stop_codon:yes gene_type:complete
MASVYLLSPTNPLDLAFKMKKLNQKDFAMCLHKNSKVRLIASYKPIINNHKVLQ